MNGPILLAPDAFGLDALVTAAEVRTTADLVGTLAVVVVIIASFVLGNVLGRKDAS